jgi:hypothetical protein
MKVKREQTIRLVIYLMLQNYERGNICVQRLSSVTSVKLKFILILNHIIAGSGQLF